MRIAIVDPSRTMLKYISRLLEARGHDALPFCNENEALKRLKFDDKIEALITSSELNGMSGVELCWETRLLATNRRPIYVILMSTSQDQNKLIEALDSGADDFISKPPVAEELYARLRAAERLAALQKQLVHLATTDPLTGAYNRRAFFELAAEACGRAEHGEKLAAIMFDIDHFKKVNDVYGHAAGDRAIKAVSDVARSEVPLVGRIGGEEFAALIEEAPMCSVVETAERIRTAISELCKETSAGVMTLTCSFGVTEWQPGDSIDRLLKRADVALYGAKSDGRNRVVVQDPDFVVTEFSTGTGVVRSRAH